MFHVSIMILLVLAANSGIVCQGTRSSPQDHSHLHCNTCNVIYTTECVGQKHYWMFSVSTWPLITQTGVQHSNSLMIIHVCTGSGNITLLLLDYSKNCRLPSINISAFWLHLLQLLISLLSLGFNITLPSSKDLVCIEHLWFKKKERVYIGFL